MMHCNEHMQVQLFGQMDVICDIPQLPMSLQCITCDGDVIVVTGMREVCDRTGQLHRGVGEMLFV